MVAALPFPWVHAIIFSVHHLRCNPPPSTRRVRGDGPPSSMGSYTPLAATSHSAGGRQWSVTKMVDVEMVWRGPTGKEVQHHNGRPPLHTTDHRQVCASVQITVAVHHHYRTPLSTAAATLQCPPSSTHSTARHHHPRLQKDGYRCTRRPWWTVECWIASMLEDITSTVMPTIIDALHRVILTSVSRSLRDRS
ncbi:hypothetical protein H257_11092 [Aphanomyces astaci]|uniref:Uncharacterized protein n=1 Tax=Aphanomyces astaci TaxID=112090 RepID=W4G353_APHAT|nr:hypothetical protein H257_11092 [Aphanomyces astaci]ETV74127.1 hypothetical protein H257_11092 [Aphanomyces astaci]|eukprot:XP_009836233.1 hypothetical protein H257_11092 [Aphanomyces astaci]